MRAASIAVLLLLAIPVALAELSKEDVIQIIRAELEPMKLDIAEIKGKMVTKDAFYGTLILMWVTIIAAIITIPYLYGRADRERVKELEARLRG